MNTNLIEKMYEFKSNIRKETNELISKYNTLTNSNEKTLLKGKILNSKAVYTEVKAALDEVKKAIELYNNDSANKNTYLNAVAELEVIANKYHVEYNIVEEKKNNNTVNRSEKKKSNFVKNAILGLGLVGIGAGVASCTINSNRNNGTNRQYETEEINSEEEIKINTESVDTTKYGMTSKFTDASDETQVMQRANDIYNKYINIDSIPSETKTVLNVEKIANIIRMCNGEFAKENGNIEYDSASFDSLGNAINTYYNSTSFEQFGTNLEFKPSSVFFVDNSLAYQVACKNDELVANIYADIKANDVNKFKEDATIWGEFVRDTVIYNDFTGKTISIWSVNAEQRYPLLKTITSVYAPSVLEYACGVDLAVRDSNTDLYGNTFGICIPYCYNEHNELKDITLSKMIYDIEETPMNSLAERAGMYEEWKQNNDSIMVQCGKTTQSWFNDKYDREVGYSKKLK